MTSLYEFAWEYSTREWEWHAVLVTDKQIQRARKVLEHQLELRFLSRYKIEPVDKSKKEPISATELFQIFRNEFIDAEKEWAP